MDSTSDFNTIEPTIIDDISSIASDEGSFSTIEHDSDDESDTDSVLEFLHEIEFGSDDNDEDDVLDFLDEIESARAELRRAQRRFDDLLGVDGTGDAAMPDAPIQPVVSEAVDMEGVEAAAPQPDAVSINGFLQVLGPDGLFYQTKYVFTATVDQATQLFRMFTPQP